MSGRNQSETKRTTYDPARHGSVEKLRRGGRITGWDGVNGFETPDGSFVPSNLRQIRVSDSGPESRC